MSPCSEASRTPIEFLKQPATDHQMTVAGVYPIKEPFSRWRSAEAEYLCDDICVQNCAHGLEVQGSLHLYHEETAIAIGSIEDVPLLIDSERVNLNIQFIALKE